MKPMAVLATVMLLLVGLAACGERPQVSRFKQGTYQGKPQTPPYESAPFDGDKASWERTLATRAQKQNEYKRINGN